MGEYRKAAIGVSGVAAWLVANVWLWTWLVNMVERPNMWMVFPLLVTGFVISILGILLIKHVVDK